MERPPLAEAELGLLRESVRQDGDHDPVLSGRSGNIMNGDGEPAERLRIARDLARPEISRLDRQELITLLASKHEPQARAEVEERRRNGARKIRTDDVIAERINEDLAAIGEPRRLSRSSVEKARVASRLPEEAKQRIREGKSSVDREAFHPGKRKSAKPAASTKTTTRRVTEFPELDQAARIRARDAELQYQSMLNAPPNKLNLPLLRRAEKIQELLTELIALDPAVAASQLPAERCRDFTPPHADWWVAFADACEQRRQEETPALQPRPFRPRHATLNPVVLGTEHLPKEERHLEPVERAVLEWIRAKPEPATATEIAVGLRRLKSSLASPLAVLQSSGLIEIVGKVERQVAYRAVVRAAEQEDPPGAEKPSA